MIKYVKGDILESKDQAIVIPVNCVGVMGKGLALQFRLKYPDISRLYAGYCAKGTIKVGQCATMMGKDRRFYIMFPTKDEWREPSLLEWIHQGLDSLASAVFMFDIETISLPRLGCGLGGLRWEDVKPMVEEFDRKFRTDNCIITVYEYDG